MNGKNKAGLTRETFLAVEQTRALGELAVYFLEEEEFSYVLLGQFQSDPIERRFGWCRRMAGSIYFVSVCQILEAEKSIRLRSLLKFSGLSLDEVKESFEEVEATKLYAIKDEANTLFSLIDIEPSLASADIEDSSVIYYVSGAFARSVSNITCCEACAELIMNKENREFLVRFEDDFEVHRREEFLNQVNRGGLVKPSDLFYIACLHVWKFFFHCESMCRSEAVFTYSLDQSQEKCLQNLHFLKWKT